MTLVKEGPLNIDKGMIGEAANEYSQTPNAANNSKLTTSKVISYGDFQPAVGAWLRNTN